MLTMQRHKKGNKAQLISYVKFLLANKRHHSWQPIHQSFTLTVTVEPIG